MPPNLNDLHNLQAKNGYGQYFLRVLKKRFLMTMCATRDSRTSCILTLAIKCSIDERPMPAADLKQQFSTSL